MSATNKTTYYELPVFIATDEPKWLTDWNGAMNIIDGAIAEAKTAADNAQTTANANALAISGLSDSVSTISTALTTLTTTVNTLNGTVNTITELIGNGTPTTTDKTIIGAINELKAEIDALAPGGEVSAAEVSYDNTSSGLTADDVQEAIDEVAGDVATLDAKVGFPTRLDNGTPQYSADGGTTWVNFNGAFSVDEVESADERAGGATVSLAAHTMTYTLLSDHDELLIVAASSFDTEDTSATAHGESVTITLTNSGTATPTEYHATSSQPFVTHKGVYVLARHTWHLENAKAGDVLTFTYTPASTSSTAAYYNTINDYTIFSIN